MSEHVLHCADLRGPDGKAFLDTLDTDPPKLMYADPPWDDLAVKRTYKSVGIGLSPPFAEVQRSVWEVAARFKIPAYSQASTRNQGQCVFLAQALKGKHLSTTPIRYAKTNDCQLVLATWGADIPTPEVGGMDDRWVPEAVLSDALAVGALQPGDRVIDPVCGPGGGTAKACITLGLRFVGLEMNPSSAMRVNRVLQVGS